jgi:hypothetical protein
VTHSRRGSSWAALGPRWGSIRPLGPAKRSDRSIPWCNTSADLDMKTLVWTRGEAFPLDQLGSRLKCPRCGNRNISVFWEIPNSPQSVRAAR